MWSRQETPTGRSNHSYVFFENTVYVQTPLNELSDKAAIFFEFKHFKAKKNKVILGAQHLPCDVVLAFHV